MCWAEAFICICSFNPLKSCNGWYYPQLCFIDEETKAQPRRLSNLPKVTELDHGKARVQNPSTPDLRAYAGS